MKQSSSGNLTLYETIERVATLNPGRQAVVDGELYSYSELMALIEAAALEIQRCGISRGDRVALFLPNSLEFVVAYFAVLGAGAIVVPLNQHYQFNEVLYFVDKSEVRLIITEPENLPLCREVVDASDCKPGILTTTDAPGLDRTADVSLSFSPVSVDRGSPVMIQFSSGSTGHPKRIARTHSNLLFELESLQRTLDIRKEDRFLGVAPFSHVNGLMRTLLTSLFCGATLVPLRKFERLRVAQIIEQERISVFIAVPFMFSILAKTRFREQFDYSTLRLCISASAPMPENLNRDFARKFGSSVRQLYGSTETGTISVNLSPEIEGSLKSVGTPVLGVEVVVVSDEGRLAAPGEIGEFAVRSPGVIMGYLDNPELNQEVFRDNFFLTGDLGRQESDGMLYLLGRKKFFINKGGYKINPAEIEEVLELHPGVAEVAVVGIPTPFGDEKVKAVVICREACRESELIEHCRGKIADFKIPSVIDFRDELPKTATGKIRKKMLQE